MLRRASDRASWHKPANVLRQMSEAESRLQEGRAMSCTIARCVNVDDIESLQHE